MLNRSLRSNAPEIPSDRWFAMMRLDQNRAKSQIAKRVGAGVGGVKNLAVWGNHSSTQFPDFENATVDGSDVQAAIKDRAWLEGDFLSSVQKRGAAVIEVRGASSAASAANAAIDTVVSLTTETAPDDCVAVAVSSNGEHYDVAPGITFGFPVQVDGQGAWRVKEGFELDDFAREKITVTTDELLAEREDVIALGLV
jgi:malate dehydrogenase